MPADGLLQTLQKIATAVHRLDEVAEHLREVRLTVSARLEKLEDHVTQMRSGSPGWKRHGRPIARKCRPSSPVSSRRWKEPRCACSSSCQTPKIHQREQDRDDTFNSRHVASLRLLRPFRQTFQ